MIVPSASAAAQTCSRLWALHLERRLEP